MSGAGDLPSSRRVKPPEGATLTSRPQVDLVKFDLMPPQELDILLLERPGAVVFRLVSDVFADPGNCEELTLKAP